MLTSIIDKIADRVRWGHLTAFFLLLVSYILTFYSSQQVINQQEEVQHTTYVINTLDMLSSKLKDAESSFRGYLIVKDDMFLKEYYNAPEPIDSTFSNLTLLTSGNNLQQQRLDTLQFLIKNKMNLMAAGLSMFKTNMEISDTLVKMGNRGKLVMDSIKTFILKLQREENDIMDKKTKRVTTLSDFIKVINVASLVIAIVLAFYSISSFNKENKAKQTADRQAEQLRIQLELRVEELKKLNTELVELRSIEKFAATGRISRTIAHEVRNPLTNINLATEHLRSEIKPSADIDILFDMVTRNSNRINELINDLLNSTKAAQLSFSRVQINDILDQSIGFAQDRLDLKGIKVVKNYAAGLPHILADIEKLNIAFLNIIVNAVEAMELQKGILTLTTESNNNRCIVTIADNGTGLDKESLSKLFEAYFTTKEQGTGLGLTNTQNIILSHYGNIFAESEEGKGSSFIMAFNYA